jgi:hypothetical protein
MLNLLLDQVFQGITVFVGHSAVMLSMNFRHVCTSAFLTDCSPEI